MPMKKDLFTSMPVKKDFCFSENVFFFLFRLRWLKKNLMHAVRRKVFVGLARYKQD
jgi:hypothetical protein